MDDLTKYEWWGQDGGPLPHLKTKTQLGKMGLLPVKAVGVIVTLRYDMLLYDINNPDCFRTKRPCSAKELAALAVKRQKSLASRRLKKLKESQNSC